MCISEHQIVSSLAMEAGTDLKKELQLQKKPQMMRERKYSDEGLADLDSLLTEYDEGLADLDSLLTEYAESDHLQAPWRKHSAMSPVN